MQFETDKATIDYEEVGEGRPILFLDAGRIGDRSRGLGSLRGSPWIARVSSRPAGHRPVVAKAELRRQDDVLEAVLAFIDRVLPDRFVLAGTSGGAYLARAVAARRGSRIDGLLLRVPAIIADTARRRTLPSFRPLVRDDALMAALGAEERAVVGDVLVQKRDYIEALGQRLSRARRAGHPGYCADRARNPRRSQTLRFVLRSDRSREDLRGADADHRRPARHHVGYRDAWDILESYPRATFVVLDRADHGWPMENPTCCRR